MSDKLKSYELQKADIVIHPEVSDLHWSSFSQSRNLVEEGARAAEENLSLIRNAMPGIKKWLRWPKRSG
jgi:hypothetical protein